MIHFILKLLLVGIVAVGVLVLLLHVFPIIVAILALAGLVKLYELFRGLRRPPPGPWR